MPKKMIRLVNRHRDRIYLDLPELDDKGKIRRNGQKLAMKRIVIGSRDDEGVAGAAQPEVEIEASEWNELLKQKAVRGLVQDRRIDAYPVG